MAANRLRESFDGCRLCIGAYKDPKLLHCLHSFCATCLDKRLQNGEFTYKIVCPTCCVDTELNQNDIAGLTTNTFIMRKQYLKGLALQVSSCSTSSMSDSTEEEAMGSDVESGSVDGTAEKMADNSERLELERSNGDGREDVEFKPETVEALSQPVDNASHHFDLLKIHQHNYCKSRWTKLSETAESRILRGELETNTMNLRMEVLNLTDAINTVDQCVKDWNHRKAELESNIRRRSHQLRRLIADEENRLLEQFEDFTLDGEFLEDVDMQKSELHSSLLSALQAVAFTRQVLVEATPEEIVDLADVLNARLRRPPLNQEISLSIPQIKFEISHKKLADIIAQDFGTIATSTMQRMVYMPRELTSEDTERYDSEELQTTSTTETILGKDFSQIGEDDKRNFEVDNNSIQQLSGQREQNGQIEQQNTQLKQNDDELQVSTTETFLVSGSDFTKIYENVENLNVKNITNQTQSQPNGERQQNGQQENDNELQVSTTETFLVSGSNFTKVDESSTIEEKKNILNDKSTDNMDGNAQQQHNNGKQQQHNNGQQQQHNNGQHNNGQQQQPKRPNNIDFNQARHSTDDKDLSSSPSTVSVEPLTFDRLSSLRTSLRERRSEILRAHSESSSPGTSPIEINCDYRPFVIQQAQGVFGSLSRPKPRKKIVRHHSFNSTLRNRHGHDDDTDSVQSHDSTVSLTIPENAEGQSNGQTDVNGNGAMSDTLANSDVSYDSPKSVRENIRRKKESWRSLNLS